MRKLVDIIATKELEVLERTIEICAASLSLEPVNYIASPFILDLELLTNLG